MSERSEPTCPSCGVAWREHDGPTGLCFALRDANARIAELERDMKFFASLGYTIKTDDRGRRYVNSGHGRHYQLRGKEDK